MVTKDAIFHYVYGVLHDPIYREKYALDLKREFPRIPFYPDFRQWADWGKRLMGLHIGYETVEPWPLRRVDTPDEGARRAGVAPKAMLKADKAAGHHPAGRGDAAFGGAGGGVGVSAGQPVGPGVGPGPAQGTHAEGPDDPRARFDTYRFADHKEKVVDLLMRVTRVSVETMAVVALMRTLPRG